MGKIFFLNSSTQVNMATKNNNQSEAEMPATITGEPTDQLSPDENLDNQDLEITENEDDEPYEGIHQGEEDNDDMIDDNMTGMPVVPSPS